MNGVILFFTLYTNIFSQSRSINMSFIYRYQIKLDCHVYNRPLFLSSLLTVCSCHSFERNLKIVNPLNPELNPIRYLLALLGAHHFLHFSRIRVKSLSLRLLMSYIYIYIYIYIYGAPILDVSRSHTTTQHSR